MSISVNPWQKFKGLLPDGARTYATIFSVDTSAGTSVVTLQNGDKLTVKGAGFTVGDRVLIADGEARTKVPALPFSALDLY